MGRTSFKKGAQLSRGREHLSIEVNIFQHVRPTISQKGITSFKMRENLFNGQNILQGGISLRKGAHLSRGENIYRQRTKSFNRATIFLNRVTSFKRGELREHCSKRENIFQKGDIIFHTRCEYCIKIVKEISI